MTSIIFRATIWIFLGIRPIDGRDRLACEHRGVGHLKLCMDCDTYKYNPPDNFDSEKCRCGGEMYNVRLYIQSYSMSPISRGWLPRDYTRGNGV